MHSSSTMYVLRLKPHEDLKRSLLRFASDRSLRAAVIVTCVGSLERVNLRFAAQSAPTTMTGHFEILSLSGTVSENSGHLHLSIADDKGQVTGGHLLDGNLIYTTAEIALAALPDLLFERAEDPSYGYRELVVKPKSGNGQP
jgi:uncharacterized protein